MKTSMDSVTVRVPGSTSNCGAGFDTLGLALQIYNRVTLQRSNTPEIAPAENGERRGQKMVEGAAQAFFSFAGAAPIGFSYRISGDVPPARGLGSSVTVIGGILAGLNVLCDAKLSAHALVEIATELEGHPDNASAGILGGFCVARADPRSGKYLGAVRFSIPDELIFVVASPNVEVVTKESRGALPEVLPYFDAVKSVNSASFLVAALAARDYAQLKYAVSDYLHEPYRLPRIPGGSAALAAGVKAGAFTGWLSGSGSSVLCLSSRENASNVGQAMKGAFEDAQISSEIRPLIADNHGLKIE